MAVMKAHTQNEHKPEHTDLEILGELPLTEALPLIMEQYQVSEDDAFELWVNNRPPTGFEDVIRLSAEEYNEYAKELKETSLGSFKLTFKKRHGDENI